MEKALLFLFLIIICAKNIINILKVVLMSLLKINDLHKLLKNKQFIYGFSGIFASDFCHILMDFKLKKS